MRHRQTPKKISTSGPVPAPNTDTLIEAKHSKNSTARQAKPHAKPSLEPPQLAKGRNADPTERRARRAEALKLLKANPELSQGEIAELTGLSRFTVNNLNRKIQPGNTHAENLKAEYQRRFRTALPVRERVAIYTEIAKARHPFASKAALARIEELEGIVTEKERRESASNAVSAAPVALFVLPGGSGVSVNPVQVLTAQKESPVLSSTSENLHNSLLSAPEKED